VFSELFRAANEERIGVNYEKKKNAMMICAKENKEKLMCKKGQTSKAHMRMFLRILFIFKVQQKIANHN
jgi:hypothetical protein